MKVTPLAIPEVLLLEPRVFRDERGFFFESFNQAEFEAAIGTKVDFVQDNHCHSTRNVLRGLHYQVRQAQGKLVHVVSGEVFDVAVDLRAGSPTLGQWHAEEISADNACALLIPPGFAHGFQTLADDCELLYCHSAAHAPQGEGGVHPHDEQLAIAWPLPITELSARDANHPRLRETFTGLPA